MIWSKEDWQSEEENKLKEFRINFVRTVKEECVGYVKARNEEEALEEFQRGNITDVDIEDSYVVDETITDIKVEEVY